MKRRILKYLPLFLAVSCFLLATIFFIFFKKFETQPKNKFFSKNVKVLSSRKNKPNILRTPTIIQNSNLIISVNPIRTSSPTLIPTNTPVPPTSTPTPVKTINLKISDPVENSSFAIDYQDNLNPCSILEVAKNNNQISSVTIAHYGPPLNSDYVSELNGYSNNWTFSLNGVTEPKGCSNYALQTNDTVLWQFN